MLNIFKTKRVEPTVAPSNYTSEIAEIHSAFDSAGEKLLAEAKAILAVSQGESVEKGKRLLSLGFRQSTEAVIAQDAIVKSALAKDVAENVSYYQKKYLNHNFITEEIVERICKKYNLVKGGIELYRGFVPEKNLREIESFKVDETDKPILCFRLTSDRPLPRTTIDESDLTEWGKSFCLRTGDRIYVTGSEGTSPYKGNELVKPETISQFMGIPYVMARPVETKLAICAPLKDMDTEGMKLNGYNLEKHIPDPIVLQPVKGGYLIVTKWGAESNDVEVQNGIHN